MREYSDWFSTALAAAALAAAVLLSPWLTRALRSSDDAVAPLTVHASLPAHSKACDQGAGAAARPACAALQRDPPNGVVTAGADKTF